MNDASAGPIGRLSRTAVRQQRLAYAGSLLVLTGALAVSLASALRSVDREADVLARRIAETYVVETVALRSWVSEQGGLYAPVGDGLAPNVHLPEDRREVTTEDGRRLVLLNPSYLTRILGVRTERAAGTRIKLTAPDPIVPANAPDAWEAAAMAEIGGLADRRWDRTRDAVGGVRYRYLAPLEAEPSCLAGCHEPSSATAYGALGALVVSYDFGPFAAAVAGQKRSIVAAHVGLWLVAPLALTAIGVALRHSLADLAAAGVRISGLERLLPICASCKKVRVNGVDASAPPRWVQIEDYVHQSVDAATFSHGVCPDCVAALDAPEVS